MIKRIYSSLLALVMVVGLLPMTAWADEPDAGSGTTTTISRFNCPTDGCTVTTTDGTSFSHSDSSCPYAEDSRYCSECGYLTHDTETDTYTHKDDCSLKETTQPPATCISCGKTEGNHKEICRFTCPTTGCTVTYDGTDYTHNASSCLYKDPEVYCTECGYMTYSQEDDDYYHADDCSIGKENQDKPSIGGDDAPGPIDQEYLVNGVTYFGVDSDHFADSTKLFIQDMLSARNKKLDNKSTAALWQYLAYCIQDDHGRGTGTGKFKRQFDDVLKEGLAYATGSTGTYAVNHHSGDNNYNVRSSGLIYANSVAAATVAMEKNVHEGYKDAGGKRGSSVKENESLRNDTDPDDVFWMATGAYKTSGKNKKGHYQALGVLFSDFTITTILPEDDGNFYQTTTSTPKANSNTYASNVKNMTNVPVSAQQEISNTTSTTATSTISGSKSYGFEESLEVGYEVGLLGGKGHANLTFTASQTIESGWSEEKSKSDEQTTTYNVGVELPAYTNIMMKQNESEATTTTKYNCPVALNFNVTIVEYTLDPSYNNADPRTQVLATFGANARKNLRQRGVVEFTLTDPNGITWENLYDNHNGLRNIVETQLTATAPMASAGATFTVVDKAVTSEISGLAPIYSLRQIKTTNDVMEYNLSTGEYLYVDTIGLEGLNAQNAVYYGFNPEKGHWILVDAKGKELNDVSDDYIAKLDTDSVTGYTKLIAGKTEGIVYLKYVIDEDVYATAEKPKSYATNNSLHSTAMIAVNVSREAFNEGTITIAGELTGIAGDPAKAIEGKDGLTVEIRDPSMKKHSRPVVWDAQELPTDGITVKNNQISFTKEGTFHVRAKTGEVFSDWYEVTALPARKLTTITIPEMLTVDYKLEHTVNLAALQVSYKDQYGADWTPVPALTWSCADEGVSIDENGVLTIPSVGTYTVTAEGGGIASNTMTITVIDSTTKVTAFTPEARTLSSSGGSVEFTITGVYLPDTGILIQANDSIKAMTTGTATEQKATLTFPANDTENDQPYTVTNSLDSRTAAVTVAKKYSGGSSGGGGGGGGGGGTAKSAYMITVENTKNGEVVSSHKTADKGDTVTLTATPDKGYAIRRIIVTDSSDQKLTLTEKDSKYTFTMPSSNVTVKTTFIMDKSKDEEPNPFADVSASSYYYNAVQWAVKNGTTGGTSATTFSPDAPCTRAQAVTFLWRAAGSPTPSSTEMPFADVPTDAYYYNAVLWAVENGITGGTSATTFSPDAPCSRGQIVAFLWRSKQSPMVVAENPFMDVNAADYYHNAVLWAAENGITGGTGANTFSPDAPCTRAQIVTFLYRALHK